MAKKHMINITDSNPSNGDLTLSDKGKTVVEKTDSVVWKVKNKSGVKKIINIVNKEGSPNVFKPDPAPNGNSNIWEGNIDKSITKTTTEDYNIEWEDDDGKMHLYDPKIQVHIRD